MPVLSWTVWQGVNIKSRVIKDLPGPCANYRRDTDVLAAPPQEDHISEQVIEESAEPLRALAGRSPTSTAPTAPEEKPSILWTWDDLTAPSTKPKGGKISFAYARKRQMTSHMATWFTGFKQKLGTYRKFTHTVPQKRESNLVGYKPDIPPEFESFGDYVQHLRGEDEKLKESTEGQDLAIVDLEDKTALTQLGDYRLSETEWPSPMWDHTDSALELHAAVRFNDAHRVRLLLQHFNVPPDILNDRNECAALVAAREGYVPCIAALLEGRADPLLRDRNKRHFGDGIWPDEHLSDLDDWGSNPKADSDSGYPPQMGRTVVYWMCIKKIIDDVLAQIDPPTRLRFVRTIADAVYEWHNTSPLCVAAQQGKPHLAAILLANIVAIPAASLSSPVNRSPSIRWETSQEDRVDALLVALAQKEWRVAEVILAAGVSRICLDTRRHKHNMSCLHIATREGQCHLLRSMLACSASPSMCNDYGRQPLHEACVAGNAGVLQVLLEAGADPNATVKSGKLCLGARAAHVGKTPLELIKAHGHLHLGVYFSDCRLPGEVSNGFV